MCKFRDMLNWRIQRPRQRPATHCRSEPKNADQSMFKVDLSTDWNSMAAGAIRRKTGTIDMEWQLFYICLDGQFVACYFFDPSEAWNKFQLKLFRMSGWHAKSSIPTRCSHRSQCHVFGSNKERGIWQNGTFCFGKPGSPNTSPNAQRLTVNGLVPWCCRLWLTC